MSKLASRARYVVNGDAQTAMDDFTAKAGEFMSLIDQTRETLMADYEAMRSQWDDASEGWQNSDRGVAVDEWITNYEALGDLLEQVHDTLDPAISGIEEMETKP